MCLVLLSPPGPSPPSPPTELTLISADHQSATLQWTIPSVAYDNESYVVMFGRDSNMLVNTSDIVEGSTDITLLNRVSGCGLVFMC